VIAADQSEIHPQLHRRIAQLRTTSTSWPRCLMRNRAGRAAGIQGKKVLFVVDIPPGFHA